MKVDLTNAGALIVSPENEVEAYALKMWGRSRKSRKGTSSLVINTEIEVSGYTSIREFNKTFEGLGAQANRFREWLDKNPEESPKWAFQQRQTKVTG